ncbi:hypothetical protein OUO20_12495 [Arthrobacter sp. FX8]|uniref:hypothetical protein n=1 Tax=Arthrobacter sp. FX8 TaxID=2997335 RepID=UPI00227BCF46|nr:hypothetical protein [Arthrobacter sp. FX8]WAJ32008.1 hypothetical protein OUO20_12495 [Arthrobacter sp. FX8]
MSAQIQSLFRRMLSAATGPLVSFLVLLALPLCGAAFLPTDQFAMWTILSTITTVALSLDFGGVALTSARFGTISTVRLVVQSSALSSVGALVVGIVSAFLWIPYSQTASARAFSFEEGLAAIALCSLAAIFRSTLAVLAQTALHLNQAYARMFLTAGQAFLCFGIALAFLVSRPSAWALPVGWSVSSAVVLIIGVIWMAWKGAFQATVSGQGHNPTSTFTFVWSRTLASLLGSAILQGDRWIIGAVAGPEFLAAYEVAWRVAALPRFLIQNLAIAVSGDAGHLYRTAPRRIPRVLRSSTLICAGIAILASVGVSAFYFVVAEPLGVDVLPTVFFSLLGAFTLIGITAPLSFLAVAIGLPTLDIAYLILTASIFSVAGIASLYLHSAILFAVGNALSISVGALWYLHYGSSKVYERCRHAARAATLRMIEST